MNKLLIAILGLGIAGYFFIYKRPPAIPKEVKVVEEQTKPVSELVVEQPLDTQVTTHLASAVAITSSTGEVSEEISETESSEETSVEREEPKENVDQTVIANEHRLTTSRSADEIFELLRKIRFRTRNFDQVTTIAAAKDFLKFLGSYQGGVLNNRGEVAFIFRLQLKESSYGGKPIFSGKHEVIKPGEPPIITELLGNTFAYQLVGRDSLVIYGTDNNYVQLYKMDNGYLAGNFYDKSSKRTRTYRFILEKK